MIQGRRGLCLALETSQHKRVSGHVLWQELESYEAMKACVLSLVDNAHASAAEPFNDVVMRDGVSDEGGEIRHFADILAEAHVNESTGPAS
jgi:hypothetical protein